MKRFASKCLGEKMSTGRGDVIVVINTAALVVMGMVFVDMVGVFVHAATANVVEQRGIHGMIRAIRQMGRIRQMRRISELGSRFFLLVIRRGRTSSLDNNIIIS